MDSAIVVRIVIEVPSTEDPYDDPAIPRGLDKKLASRLSEYNAEVSVSWSQYTVGMTLPGHNSLKATRRCIRIVKEAAAVIGMPAGKVVAIEAHLKGTDLYCRH